MSRLTMVFSIASLLLSFEGLAQSSRSKIDSVKEGRVLLRETLKQQRVYKKLSKTHKNSDDDCVFTNKYTAAQRLNHYPFSKAVKILAVSFPYGTPNNTDDRDTIKYGLHIKKGLLNYTSLIEVKTLTLKQINKLTNLVFNTDERKPLAFPVMGRSCFNPHNALIFYDRKGEIFDYFEVCFECLQERSLSNNLLLSNYCNQKYDLLKDFFVGIDIKYGTIRTY